VKREAAVVGLASEGLALVSGSAGAGSSAVVALFVDPILGKCVCCFVLLLNQCWGIITVCVLLCFIIKLILGNRYGPGFIP